MAGSQSSVALTAVTLEHGGAVTTKATTYSVDSTKTPMGLGISLSNDVVTEIKPSSQVARDGKVQVGHRVLAVNGETTTAANPSSTILQAIGNGSVARLEFTSEKKVVSTVTETGQSSSVSVEPSVSVSPPTARLLPLTVLARDSQKMRRAADLLEAWKLAGQLVESGLISGATTRQPGPICSVLGCSTLSGGGPWLLRV
jgi:hypothetical protein